MKKRILLVDDSLTVRTFEKLALGDRYDFLEAGDGRAALEIASAQRPDVILLDVLMPGMNGVDALRELRTRDQTRAIPVIMVTTRSEAEVRTACETLGVSDFVYKPIDREQLRATVARSTGAGPGAEAGV